MAKNSDEICVRKSTHYLKIPLKSTEQVYLIFLIPAIISCIVYIIHFSADLVIAVQHIREKNLIWGCCTISLMYAPAIAYFILTVSRPDWWMTDDDKLTKGVFGWFTIQLCQLIAFALFALYRYAGLIVLSVDAILLSSEERTKTLNVAAAPAAIELYFFLQAWFQAAPQAVFQLHLLFRESSIYRSHQSVVVQVLSIFMSVIVLAIETTAFQRFESQRVNGRKLPWAMWLKKYCFQELNNLEERAPLQSLDVKSENTTQNIQTDSNIEIKEEPKEEVKLEEVAEANSNDETQTESHLPLDRQISTTPPLPPKNAHITPPPTPLRGITTVTPLPVPDVPAPPRPDSICTSPEQQETDQRPKSVSIIESSQKLLDTAHDLKVPKRKYSSKGLEEDDPVGKFLSFLWWFFFITARIFSIVVFYEFYPYYLLLMLSIHYIVMLIYLFYYSRYYDAITFIVNLWLGLVYIFSLIEYRVKFKYADKWLLPYYVFVILQNTFITLIWYFNADWEGFWFSYIFYAIFVSMSLCILSTVVYHVLFKPKKCRVYNS